MKLAKCANLFAVLLMLGVNVVGCKKKLQNTTPLPGAGMTTVGGRDTPSPRIDPPPYIPPVDRTPVIPTVPPPDVATTGIAPTPGDFTNWIEDRGALKDFTVYFEFDKANVKPSEISKLEAVASRFKEMPGKAIRIEGHCDERGTEEYNRALGEKRALSVREYLVGLGVSADMLPTITYGEERPVDPGHSDAAWSKNRRGELILLSPPK